MPSQPKSMSVTKWSEVFSADEVMTSSVASMLDTALSEWLH